MKFNIKRHKNGLVICLKDEAEGIVYSEKNEDEIEGWAQFLRELTDSYGPQDHGRYSEKRLHITIQPGDKWEPEKEEDQDKLFCIHCGSWIGEYK